MLAGTFTDTLGYKINTDRKGLMRWLEWVKSQGILFRYKDLDMNMSLDMNIKCFTNIFCWY